MFLEMWQSYAGWKWKSTTWHRIARSDKLKIKQQQDLFLELVHTEAEVDALTSSGQLGAEVRWQWFLVQGDQLNMAAFLWYRVQCTSL